jgi:hypothetical protein
MTNRYHGDWAAHAAVAAATVLANPPWQFVTLRETMAPRPRRFNRCETPTSNAICIMPGTAARNLETAPASRSELFAAAGLGEATDRQTPGKA